MKKIPYLHCSKELNIVVSLFQFEIIQRFSIFYNNIYQYTRPNIRNTLYMYVCQRMKWHLGAVLCFVASI